MKRLMILMVALAAQAQDVSFEVAPREIGINETVQFSVVISGAESNTRVTFPNGFNVGDFQLYSPRPNVQTSMTFINNRRSVRYSETYRLVPAKKGTFTLPAQTVKVMGKTFRSDPVEITVRDQVQTVQPRSRRRDFFGRERGPMKLFIEARVPKRAFYLGEPIPYQVYLYQTPNFTIENRGADLDMPEFREFWMETLELPRSTQREVIRDNTRMYEYLIDSRRLYANNTGDITIEPTRLSVYINVNSPMSVFTDSRREERVTEAVNLTIKPLPEQGKPADFAGAVGRFKLDGNLEASEVKAGEAVTLKLRITGDGNFGALEDIAPVLPESQFEIFPGGTPETETENGVVRAKTWVYALVPKQAGQFDIQVPELNYFDYTTGTYSTTGGASLSLNVLEGSGLPSGGNMERDQTLSAQENLQFIKLGPLEVLDARRQPQSPRWLMGIAGALVVLNILIFLGLATYRKQAEVRQQNRPKFAWKNFKRAIGRINAGSGDADAFYADLSGAFLNYFGDKWERRGQGISLEYIRERFHREQLDDALLERVTEVVEACDLARFTPSSTSSREQLLNKAEQTLRDVDEVLA